MEHQTMFDALCELRSSFIEPPGWRILCNGARVDAWPSGMSMDFSGGMLLTVLTRGRVRSTADLAFIFDPAPATAVGTVEQQQRYVSVLFECIDAGIDPAVPSAAAIEEARGIPSGWVYMDEAGRAGSGPAPAEGILGGWKVDGRGELTGEFLPNPAFVPSEDQHA
jgi:hypothetical protein